MGDEAGTVIERRSGFDVRKAGIGLTAAGGGAEVPRDAVIYRTNTHTTTGLVLGQ